MSVDKKYVLNALLKYNYFPMQREDRDELPPIFSSEKFTPALARIIVAGGIRCDKGYDVVEYMQTRFNGVSRVCSIPHPAAYANLSLSIHKYWRKLDYIANNENSIVKPTSNADGRLIIMDYEKSVEKTKRNLKGVFGKRFMVHTDISNFFPSVYSHAFPWATVGFDYAKSHRSTTEWFNEIDTKLRMMKRNETQGVAIGPASSNIVSEAILDVIDKKLRRTFGFIRYIDDYTAYCKTEEEAQEFVRQLSAELANYKLMLSLHKTEVIQLPYALNDGWISELVLGLPRGAEITSHDAVNYLNMAVKVANVTPDGSVLKYALKCLVNSRKLTREAECDVLSYGLTLSFHHPLLLPLLKGLFEKLIISTGQFEYNDQLMKILNENARFRRSDGMAWVLYYMIKYKVSIDKIVAQEVLATEDCIALLMLYYLGDKWCKKKIVAFTNGLDLNDLYKLDQYWLLLYQIFKAGKIADPYPSESAFKILKRNNVSFIRKIA